MTGANRRRTERPRDVDTEAVLEAVRQAALDLLESLPDRPERLRVRTTDVTVDLDWRSSAVARMMPSSDDTERIVEPPVRHPSGRSQDLATDERESVLHYVCAPSVGTFYRASEPGAVPFTTEDSVVNAGQQVAIVEAMKLMLPVEADRPGRVVEVLIEDGQAVEYGERLMVLAPVGTE